MTITVQLSTTIFRWSLSTNFHRFLFSDCCRPTFNDHFDDYWQSTFIDRFLIIIFGHLLMTIFGDCCQPSFVDSMIIVGQLSLTVFLGCCLLNFVDCFSSTIVNLLLSIVFLWPLSTNCEQQFFGVHRRLTFDDLCCQLLIIILSWLSLATSDHHPRWLVPNSYQNLHGHILLL